MKLDAKVAIETRFPRFKSIFTELPCKRKYLLALQSLILMSFTELIIFYLVFIVLLGLSFTKQIKFLEGSVLACLFFSLYILTYG